MVIGNFDKPNNIEGKKSKAELEEALKFWAEKNKNPLIFMSDDLDGPEELNIQKI